MVYPTLTDNFNLDVLNDNFLELYNQMNANYTTSATVAATAAKVATLANFVLVAGAKLFVKFTYANTAAAPTLNISSTGAKAIKSYNTTAPLTNWVAGDVVEFVYDGTNYIMQPTMGMVDGINTSLNVEIDKTIYSSTEKRIGTWVDGKPIYRVQISGFSITVSNTAWTSVVPSSSMNISTLVRGDLYGLNILNACAVRDQDGYIKAQCLFNGGTFIGADSLVLEYTKTTD